MGRIILKYLLFYNWNLEVTNIREIMRPFIKHIFSFVQWKFKSWFYSVQKVCVRCVSGESRQCRRSGGGQAGSSHTCSPRAPANTLLVSASSQWPRHSGLTWLLSHRVMVSSWEMRGRSCQWYNNLILNLKSIFSCNFRKLAQSWNVCLCAISLKKKDLTKDQSENMYKINPGWFFSYFWSFWMNRFRFFLVLCICIFPTQNVEAGIKDVGNTVWHFQKFSDSIGLSSSTDDHFIFQCSISSGKLASKFV